MLVFPTEKGPSISRVTTFRINTCKSVSKQRTLTPFRINTYEKQGEGGTRLVPPGRQICAALRHARRHHDLKTRHGDSALRFRPRLATKIGFHVLIIRVDAESSVAQPPQNGWRAQMPARPAKRRLSVRV